MSLRITGLRGRFRIPIRQFIRFNSTIYNEQVVPFFNNLSKSSRLRDFHTSYPKFAAQMKRHPNDELLTGDFVSECDREVSSILDVLASSGSRIDLERIDEILDDMPKLFLIKPNLNHHSVILRALLRRGDPLPVERWLLNMEKKPPYVAPLISQYHAYLLGCTDKVAFKTLKRIVRTMSQSGCNPTNETFCILFSLIWRMTTDLNDGLVSLIQDMKALSLPYDPAVPRLIRDGLTAHGHAFLVDSVIAKYTEAMSFTPSPEQEREMSWANRISEASKTGGLTEALSEYENFLQSGGKLSEPIEEALLSHSRNLSDLDHLEQALGISPSTSHWSILLSNNLQSNKLADATSIYREALRRGTKPSTTLTGPLIKRLATVNDFYLDQALAIYRTFSEAFPPPKQLTTIDLAAGPNADIYKWLFDGLCCRKHNKHLPVVDELLGDMKARGIQTGLVTHQLIIILMKTAPDESAAFEAYRNHHDKLTQHGYYQVLDVYSQLKFDKTFTVPSTNNYFDMVNDMRLKGLKITRGVYSIFLRQISRLTTEVSQSKSPHASERLEELARATRRTHDLLTLDAYISPDSSLWNDLMDLYQRQRHFSNACRVWDEMYLSDRYDDASVSIILEACGRNHAQRMADQIYGRLRQDGHRFSIDSLNSWVRCLCRFSRLDEAAKFVCLDMSKGQDGVAPNVETVKILLFFARRAQLEGSVLARIKQHLPSLWYQLPVNMKKLQHLD